MEQIVNMRDLGGLITQDGQMIKPSKLLRSGNPGVASEEDRLILEQLGLEQVIDFRGEEEKHSSEKSFAKRFNWIAQPVFLGNIKRVMDDKLTVNDAQLVMEEIYQRFPVEFQAQYQYFLKQAEQGATMLYHCTAGKDRTGFGSLLLLSALGVDNDMIMEDYLLSNQAIAGLREMMAIAHDEKAPTPEVLNAILGVTPDYLDASLQVINKQFGGMAKYLKYTLDIDADRIRKNYLKG